MTARKRYSIGVEMARLVIAICGVLILAGQVGNIVPSPTSIQIRYFSEPDEPVIKASIDKPSLSNQRIVVIDIEKAERTEAGPTNLLRTLKQLTRTPLRVVHYTDPSLREVVENSATRAVIIGGQGTPWWLYTNEELAQVTKVIREAEVPVLGICGGHQLIAIAFGAPVAPIRAVVPKPSKSSYEGYWRERGWVQVKFINDDEVLMGCKTSELVWQNHCEEVKSLPKDFVQLAVGAQSPMQMFRHSTKLIYGCQFHPERWTSQHPVGRRILENFLSIVGTQTALDTQNLNGAAEMLPQNVAGSRDRRSAPVLQ